MSVNIKYKGNTIASADTDTTSTLKTAGKYCQADIIVENTRDDAGSDFDIRINKEYSINWTDDVRWKNDNTTASAEGYSSSDTVDCTDADWVMIDWGNTAFVSGKYYGRLRMVGNANFSAKEVCDGYVSYELDRYAVFKMRSGYAYMHINKIKGENCKVYSVSINTGGLI